MVFEQVRNGTYKARTLTDPHVEERILLNISAKQQQDYNSLIANVEPIDSERQALIDERLKSFKDFQASTAQLDSGQRVFYANCNACHQKYTLSGIGPQLHGIGKRGADAIAEKIIDPNRNITEAFRNYTIKLKDGKVLTGLYRREEGAVVIFGDLSGKEFSIAKKDIAEQKASRYTIMPDHFGSTLSQREFNNLLAYLLTW
jgi:putative heme-binding domain-containing protein